MILRYLISQLTYVRSIVRQSNIRVYWRTRGLNLAPTALLRIKDPSRLIVEGSCSVGDFTIIDIADDPSEPEKQGRLTLGNNSYIGDQCNIRAAGSTISIGKDSMIASNTVLVSSNHQTKLGTPMRLQPWETKTGISIGSDVWIGSNVTILAGSNIGDGAIIAAGSVVRSTVAPLDIVAGVPSKFIKNRRVRGE